MKALELFAGAGGLAMGVTLAGFSSVGVVERNRSACNTLRRNQARGYPLLAEWPIIESDVNDLDFREHRGAVALVAGGPPCQPFSQGGKHGGYDDSRDMFPATVRVIRDVQPQAFILENVKGLTRPIFKNYLQYILLQLEFPTVVKRPRESWEDHYSRLEAEKSSGVLHRATDLSYHVIPHVANAADFGVPQKRERIFIVGFRTDLQARWSFPAATHSLKSLLYDQYVSLDYWERNKVAKKARHALDARFKRAVEELRGEGRPLFSRPWRTVRDALHTLPDPRDGGGPFSDHRFQPGARVYPGHTGSRLDSPAKTLKAGDHGVPGGENMLVDAAGPRYFTVRESARLQTFPDGFVFDEVWTESMRQLGNAVPVQLARIVAASVAESLIEVATRVQRGA